MKGFQETLSALGDFWLQEEPSIRWPGTISFKDFPDVRVTTNGRDAVPHFRDKILHGETTDPSYVSIFGASGVPQGWRRETTDPNSPPKSTSAHLTGNYMLIGDALHDASDSVKRASFNSIVADRVLPHYADPFFADLTSPRRQKSFRRKSNLFTQMRSTVCHDHNVRFRVIRSLLPNAVDGQRLRFTISFLTAVSPQKAMVMIIHFEELLSLICGHLVDIINVNLLHITEKGRSRTKLYFSNFVDRRCTIEGQPLPLIDFTGSSRLFRDIVRNWVSEEQSTRSRRRLYVSSFKYTSPNFSQFRDIFSSIEMLIDQDDKRPLGKTQFKSLNRMVSENIVSFFATNNIDNDQAIDHFKRYFAVANSYTARQKIEIGMQAIPTSLRHRIFLDEKSFVDSVLRIRNKAVHDLGELTQDDYVDITWFIRLLKFIYAAGDLRSLGALETNFLSHSELIQDILGNGAVRPSQRINSLFDE